MFSPALDSKISPGCSVLLNPGGLTTYLFALKRSILAQVMNASPSPPQLCACPALLTTSSPARPPCGQSPGFSVYLEAAQRPAGKALENDSKAEGARKHKGGSKICQFIYPSRRSL